MPLLSPKLLPILFLIGSNLFMTVAWYGHLKFKDRPLWLVILVSWGIAFFEYCLAVPANRIGSGVYSAAQLKAMQEVITLTVFAGFSIVWIANLYMSLFGRLRLAITSERQDIEVVEKMVKKDEDDLGAKG